MSRSIPLHRPIEPPRRRSTAPKLALALALGSLLAVGAADAPAQIYRYVDETGETVYSRVPPPTGDATKITPDPGPSEAETQAATERLRRQLETDFDRRHEAKRQAELEAKEAQSASERAEACSAARRNLDTLSNLGGRFLTLPDGRTVKPDAAQQQRLIDEAREQIQQFCD
jgi:hypothetical protein